MRRARINLRVLGGLGLSVVLGAMLAACGLMLEPDESRSRFTDVATPTAPVRLHSEEDGSGETVLLLHGFGASSYTYNRIQPGLARSHRVIALDLKGFGRSDKPFDEAYSPLDQAALVAQFIRKRGLTGITLAGHSFGGAVALATTLELNRTEPRRIKRLILLDAAAYDQGLPPVFYVLRTPGLAEATVSLVLPEVQATGALLAAYNDPSKVRPEDIAAYARPMYEAGNRHALIQTAAKIVPVQLRELTRQYRSIPQPTLLLWCRSDQIVKLEIARRLMREMPNARLEVIESCGHVPHEEEPETTLRLIRGFLRG